MWYESIDMEVAVIFSVPMARCSFCGKKEHEVRKLISGSNVLICDECVKVCTEIIALEESQGRIPKEKPPRPREIEPGWTVYPPFGPRRK
jgi:ATP-dependent Clp protease ATP-binding subunit ClpX